MKTSNEIIPTERRIGLRSSKSRSQAAVEFGFVAVLMMILLLGLLDLALMVMRYQTVAAAVREGASTASRVTANNLERGLDASLGVCTNALTDMLTKGGVIVTLVERAGVANSVTLVNPVISSVLSTGLIYGGGDTLKNQSYILHTNDWQNPERILPFNATDLTIGKGLYVVEVIYTNEFLTPLNKLVGITFPPVIKDIAYFVAP